MKSLFKLNKLFLVLALIPASASAALIVSDWTATPTSLSFKITGTIDEGVPFGTATQLGRLFIGPSSLPQDPEKDSASLGMVTSLGGSPTALGNITDLSGDQGAVIFNDSGVVNIQIEKANDAAWQTGDILNYSISFADVGLYDFSSWDPSGAIVSAGRSDYASAPEAQYQVGSFASVPDTGSTAALLGVGVAALAFARRRLG